MKKIDYEYIRNNEDENVCVSVLVLVYNHALFLRQAMDSVLMQKTQYSYKIVVGEDCSTDNSRDILMEYYQKYPDKIELVLYKENVGAERNWIETAKVCSGKYIAYLEGDDYWTDPLKLEKQISFLEENKQYIGTAHNVRCVDKNGKFLHRDFNLYSYQTSHIYDFSNVKRVELVGQTASMLHKNIWKKFNKEDWEKFLLCNTNGDLKMSLVLGNMGSIYYLCDIMSDHRRVFDEGDSWTAQNTGKNMLWFNFQTRLELQKYMMEAFNIDLEIDLEKIAQHYLKESVIQVLYKPTMENFNILCKFYSDRKKREWSKLKSGLLSKINTTSKNI